MARQSADRPPVWSARTVGARNAPTTTVNSPKTLARGSAEESAQGNTWRLRNGRDGGDLPHFGRHQESRQVHPSKGARPTAGPFPCTPGGHRPGLLAIWVPRTVSRPLISAFAGSPRHRTPSTPALRSRCFQRSAHSSPRRVPVTMASHTSTPQPASARPCLVEDARRLDGGWPPRIRPRRGRRLGLPDRAGSDPPPAHGALEGAVDDEVDLPDGRGTQRSADVRPAAVVMCSTVVRCWVNGRRSQCSRHRRSSA
jgi:hypothetical protein